MLKYYLYLLNKHKFVFIFINTFALIVLLSSFISYDKEIIIYGNTSLYIVTTILSAISILCGLYVRFPFLYKNSIDTYGSFPLSLTKQTLVRLLVYVTYTLITLIILTLACLIFNIIFINPHVDIFNPSSFFIYLLVMILIMPLICLFTTGIMMFSTNIVDSIIYILYTLIIPFFVGLFFDRFARVTFPLYGTVDNLTTIIEKSIIKNLPLLDELQDILVTNTPFYLMILIFVILGIFALKYNKNEDSEDVNTSVFNHLIPVGIALFLLICSVFTKEFYTIYIFYFILISIPYILACIFFKRRLRLTLPEIIVYLSSIIVFFISCLFE